MLQVKNDKWFLISYLFIELFCTNQILSAYAHSISIERIKMFLIFLFIVILLD